MNSRQFTAKALFASVVILLLGATMAADLKIPVENLSGRYMKVVATGPDGKKREIELAKTDKKKDFDNLMDGFYELRVSDGKTTVFIGRFNLKDEKAKNKNISIILTSRYSKPAKGKIYLDPNGSLGKSGTIPLRVLQ